MTTDAPEGYTEVIDALWEKYKPRIDAKLNEVRKLIEQTLGWDCDDVYDMSDEEYDHRFVAWYGPAQFQVVDISMALGEALVYGDGPWGVSFRFDMVGYGGRIIGGFAPYNYTEQVWVDARSPEAVEERWQIMETADLSEIPTLLQDYLDEVATDINKA